MLLYQLRAYTLSDEGLGGTYSLVSLLLVTSLLMAQYGPT